MYFQFWKKKSETQKMIFDVLAIEIILFDFHDTEEVRKMYISHKHMLEVFFFFLKKEKIQT